jgi:hypothetical protein
MPTVPMGADDFVGRYAQNFIKREGIMFGITEAKIIPDDTLKAYRIGLELKFDLELAEIAITSWSLKEFRIAGPDLFDLLDRVPGAIAEWFHDNHQVEVAVVPVFSTFDPKARRIDDGFVVIPMRSIVAAARDVTVKP